MNLVTFLATYIMVWWVLFFMALPWGINKPKALVGFRTRLIKNIPTPSCHSRESGDPGKPHKHDVSVEASGYNHCLDSRFRGNDKGGSGNDNLMDTFFEPEIEPGTDPWVDPGAPEHPLLKLKVGIVSFVTALVCLGLHVTADLWSPLLRTWLQHG
ncbi:MAG: hypothetical protein ACRCYZ_01500 [Alphaproteobacteria bacterium]